MLEGEFSDLVRTLQPTPKLYTLARTMFQNAWTQRSEQAAVLRDRLEKQAMTIRARLDRIEKGMGVDNGWIEAELSPETKLLLMEHHLLLRGEEGALVHARDLHARKERRPLAPPPIPKAVEEQLEAWSEETRLHHEALPAEERVAMEHAQAERQALAKRLLDEASAEHQAA